MRLFLIFQHQLHLAAGMVESPTIELDVEKLSQFHQFHRWFWRSYPNSQHYSYLPYLSLTLLLLSCLGDPLCFQLKSVVC